MAFVIAILVGVLYFWWEMGQTRDVREIQELKRLIKTMRMVGMGKEADELNETLKRRTIEALKKRKQ